MVMAERRWLCDRLADNGIAVNSVIVADDENLEIAAEYGFPTVEMDNDHGLGRKCNAGYEYAARQGADLFVPVGSDDWVHPDAFAVLPHRRQIVAFRDIAVVDLCSARLSVIRSPGDFGVIPWLIPRAELERSDFRPIQPELTIGMEGSMLRSFRPGLSWIFLYKPDSMPCVDFKTPRNLCSYEELLPFRVGDEADAWAMLDEHYPSYLIQMARAIHENLKEPELAEKQPKPKTAPPKLLAITDPGTTLG